MATQKQRQAAKRNVRKAISAAKRKKTIAHMPKKTRTALGKQGAAVAQRKRLTFCRIGTTSMVANTPDPRAPGKPMGSGS